MSSEIPKFKVGDRIQCMQTDDNIEHDIAAVCGVIIEVNNLDAYRVFLENGHFIQIHGWSLNHISEEQYHNWRKNGCKTWEAWHPKPTNKVLKGGDKDE